MKMIEFYPICFRLYFHSDLKSMTDPELWKAFDDNFEMITNVFENYLKQTDATVITSDDYEPFDIISLMTTDQFSIMLDILFEKLVKIGEFGDINVGRFIFSSCSFESAFFYPFWSHSLPFYSMMLSS